MATALVFTAMTGFVRQSAAHGDLHDRIVALTWQISTNQTVPELWLERADLHRRHRDFNAAQADLEHVFKLRPAWSSAALQQARLSFDLEDFSHCERAATDCLSHDPTNADALVLRARSLVHLNKLSAAIRDYDTVLTSTNFARPLPDLFIERARAQAAHKNLDAAVAGLDTAIRLLGETPSFAFPAIEYERQRGAFSAALERLERARKFLDHESFLTMRGEILLQAGRPAEARQDFLTVFAILEKLPPERRSLSAWVGLEERLRVGLKEVSEIQTNRIP
jgi:tetratricopeptide (TPR) repeat protein